MADTKGETLYRLIKEDIVENRYTKGDIINERELAEKYNVSKTPVREALTALVTDGFLIKYPHRGYFIKEIDMAEYMDLLQYRCLLESGILYYIIKTSSDEQIKSLYEYTPEVSMSFEEWQDANVQFHMALARLTGNKCMEKALADVFAQTKRKTSLPGYKALGNDVHRDHRKIVDAVLERNYEKTAVLIRKDLERSDEENKLV